MSFLNNILQKNLGPAEGLVQPRLPGLFEPTSPHTELSGSLSHKPEPVIDPQREPAEAGTVLPPQPMSALRDNVPIDDIETLAETGPTGESVRTEKTRPAQTPTSPRPQPQMPPKTTDQSSDRSPTPPHRTQASAAPDPLTDETATPDHPIRPKEQPSLDHLDRKSPALPPAPDESLESRPSLWAEPATTDDSPEPAAPNHSPRPLLSVTTVNVSFDEPNEPLPPQVTAESVEQAPENPTPSPRRIASQPRARTSNFARSDRLNPAQSEDLSILPEQILDPPRLPVVDREQSMITPILVETEAAPTANEPTPLPDNSFRRQSTLRPIAPLTRANRGESPHTGPIESPPTPTINVRIGRIEVKATPPATSKPRRPKQTTPVMTLDDYLRQRNRGGG